MNRDQVPRISLRGDEAMTVHRRGDGGVDLYVVGRAMAVNITLGRQAMAELAGHLAELVEEGS